MGATPHRWTGGAAERPARTRGEGRTPPRRVPGDHSNTRAARAARAARGARGVPPPPWATAAPPFRSSTSRGQTHVGVGEAASVVEGEVSATGGCARGLGVAAAPPPLP